MALTLEITTPDKKVFSTTCEQVVLPTDMGDTGILPGHVPLIARIKAGEVRVMNEGKTEHLAVAEGFARVIADTVDILTEAAIDVAEIDMGEVESAQRRAEEALRKAREENADPTMVEKFESNLRFVIAQKLAKGRRRM